MNEQERLDLWAFSFGGEFRRRQSDLRTNHERFYLEWKLMVIYLAQRSQPGETL